ncbi:MAG: hypothetical protein RL291_685 [Pseudomonadota bacterium]|jgi:hypothetical protein
MSVRSDSSGDALAAALAQRDAPKPAPTPERRYTRIDALNAVAFAVRTINNLLGAKSTPGQRAMAAEATAGLSLTTAWLDPPRDAPVAPASPSADLTEALFTITTGPDGHLVATTKGLGPIVIAASDRAELDRMILYVVRRYRTGSPAIPPV